MSALSRLKRDQILSCWDIRARDVRMPCLISLLAETRTYALSLPWADSDWVGWSET